MKSTSSDGSTQKMAHSMSRQLSTQISTQPSEKEKPDSKEEEEEEVFSIRSSDIEGLSGVEVRDIFVHIT
jgi:flavodoxin